MSDLNKLEEVSDQLDAFGSAEMLRERQAALAELRKKRALNIVRDDHRFKVGLKYLGELAASSPESAERLGAVASLARIGSIKSLAEKTGQILSSALKNQLPDLMNLQDPDDRYYVASALHHGKQGWIFEYAAVGVVEEKQAEKARKELVAVLFNRAETLSDVFRVLVQELKKFIPETKKPGDSVARRLERILAAIRPLAVSVLIDPGHGVGNSLKDMIRSAFSGAQSPETPEIAGKTMEEIAGLLHDIARTQISMVAEPSLYSVLDIPKGWVTPPEWRYIAEKSPNLQLVTRDIRGALTLLAKQGATDIDLFEQLTKSSGSREGAIKITSDIVEQHPELNAETAAWLRCGGKLDRSPTLGAMVESRELSADPVLATLMTDSSQLGKALSGVSEDILTELRLLEPVLAEPIDVLIIRCRGVLNDVNALAGKRGLSFRGVIGESVEYSQNIHELVGGHLQGIRKVRFIQPMIVREGTDGAVDVVRKALVEKL